MKINNYLWEWGWGKRDEDSLAKERQFACRFEYFQKCKIITTRDTVALLKKYKPY
jgi:hypothetical protein